MSLLASTLPIELIVRDRRCVVLGGDGEAASKVARLASAGARITVVHDGALDPELEAHARAGTATVERRTPTEADAHGAVIVFVTPEHQALGERLAARAEVEGRLVCTLDRPHAATFVNPSVVDLPHVRVAFSSGGTAPAFLRRLRIALERTLSEPRLVAFVRRLVEERRALPPGERSAALRERTEGFDLVLTARYPAWFEDPPNEEKE